MVRPVSAQNYQPIDLKLGIKSSLPAVKPTLALLFLMWELNGRPAKLVYCQECGEGVELLPDIEETLYAETSSLGAKISSDKFHELLSGNYMLKSQMEALVVTFELMWKVAKIRFTDDRNISSEREGGVRFPKRLEFSSNMDLFHSLICFHRDSYLCTLFAWLGVPVQGDPQAEAELIRFLTVISEGAYYKLIDGGNDVIFNTESLYATILAHDEPVDVTGDVEPKGALRIFKSALSENLFADLQARRGQVSAKDHAQLEDYHARVSIYHQLCVIPARQSQSVPASAPPEDEPDQPATPRSLRFETGLTSDYPRNRIVFGAPGTGKSFLVNQQRVDLLQEDSETNYERVTFHPDYSYANFVGTYKPVSEKENEIAYEYVPGPFMRVYVNAMKSARTDAPKPYLLIIEEINRANVAAVFGDVFQLLDRGDNQVSEYPIQVSEDVKKYLFKELGGQPDDYTKIRLPDNLFIWATMNSADQGVFPMDTAFKRRWSFTYLGIDDNEENIQHKYVYLADDRSQQIEWNRLRKAINHFLARERINEDKQLGPYFLSKALVAPEGSDEIDREQFIHAFKNKVIMYLFEDAAKQKRAKLFEGCTQDCARYSEICREFEKRGIHIFHHDIQNEAAPGGPQDT